MEEIKCILCESDKIHLIAPVNTSELARLYHIRAGVNVKKFFLQDSIHLYHCKNCDLKFFWPAVTGDGKFYDDLQEYPGYFLKDKFEYLKAAEYIDKNDDVLEIGCGEGIFTNFITCRSYHGLELSDKAIAKAKEKGIDIGKQSIEEYSAHTKTRYDVVCFFQVLEHISDPKKFITNALKCLNPGGKLIIAVPSEDSFIKDAVNFYLNMPPHHVSRWTDRCLEKIATLFGLTINSTIHEPLHSIHKNFYLKTKFFTSLSGFLGIRRKQINMSFAGTVVYAMSAIAAFFCSPFLGNKRKINGQSVLVVYTKH